jgi:hypothetical protein
MRKTTIGCNGIADATENPLQPLQRLLIEMLTHHIVQRLLPYACANEISYTTPALQTQIVYDRNLTAMYCRQ